MLINIVIIFISYLIGSLPHLYYLCKLHRIDMTGDLHADLWRGAGPFWGLGSILIDILKGAIPIWLGKALGLDLSIIVTCGLAAVAGQMWPVFLKFNGEKGNTPGLGMALTLAYQPTLVALVPVLYGLVSKLVRLLNIKGQSLSNRFRSGAGQSDALPIGVALGFLVLPIASYCLVEPTEVVLGFIILLVIIMLRRLTQGLTEDLKKTRDLKVVLYNRLLYDRSQR
jgi:glycerol-3-phosphate acyltransferase PlsY